jgi:hypothetical protein
MVIDEYAVVGSKVNAQKIRQLVNRHFIDRKIAYFIENLNFNRIGSEVEDESGGRTPIISLYAFAELYAQGKVKGALIPSEMPVFTMRVMRKRLLDAGIPEESIFAVPITAFRKDALTDDEILRIFTPYSSLVQIYDLYVNVTGYCNLNCRSCTVCSNLVEGKPVYALDAFTKDLRRLHELVPDIVGLGLAGGEPLLLDNLCEYIEVARDIYPHAGITVSTNGILLPGLSREKLHIMLKNKVKIRLSLYPPLRKNLDTYLGILREYGIPFYVSDYEVFGKAYVRKPYFDKQERFATCGAPCAGFRNGHISYCEVALFVGNLNKKFGLSLPEYGGIDIHTPSLTGEKLMRKMEKPLDICSWCTIGLTAESRPWAMSYGDDVPEDYFLTYIDTIVANSCEN